jgi:methylenetetrahydrofolate reductase (NADPH)
VGALKELSPSFVSMTYGAGGSTRAKTIDLVSKIKHDIGIEAAAHLTCVGHSQSELKEILGELEKKGVENIIALRGDPPKGEKTFTPAQNGFRYASELVKFIRSQFSFSIGVAGYPEKHVEAESLEKDITHLKEKITAGGDFVVTQLFFDNADYFSYVEKLKATDVHVPVIAGIMPITDADQIKRFATMCGAKIPKRLAAALEEAKGDKEKVVEIGIQHAVSQCQELLDKKIPGIHFYTLNKSRSTREIFLRLRRERVER